MRGEYAFVRGLAFAAAAFIASAPITAAADPGTTLVLSITHSGAPAGKMVTLRCDPPLGTHPAAAEACAQLKQSGGDFYPWGGPTLKPCPMVYAPVTVSAKGHIDGKLVRFEASFPNDCLLTANTGQIFVF